MLTPLASRSTDSAAASYPSGILVTCEWFGLLSTAYSPLGSASIGASVGASIGASVGAYVSPIDRRLDGARVTREYTVPSSHKTTLPSAETLPLTDKTLPQAAVQVRVTLCPLTTKL